MTQILQRPLDRRAFMKIAAAGVAGTVSGIASRRALAAEPTAAGASTRAAGRLGPDELKAALRGPILSVPTPFTRDGAVDEAGPRRMIDLALAHDVRIFSLTSGNSYYHALSYEEVKQLTRVLVEAVGGRGVTIAATDTWWTDRTLDYARYAERIGADAIQVLLPTRTDAAAQVDHYKAVAQATSLPIVLHGLIPLPVLDQLVAIDAVAAAKEDGTLADFMQWQRRYGDRLAIFAGGQKNRFLVGQPYGAQAYYSVYATFAPQVVQRFQQALERDDLAACYQIVRQYEFPFFDRWSHAMWRASLEHFGVAQRYLRLPERSFTDEQMANVAEFFNGLELRAAT